MIYDVTIITVQPGSHPKALARLEGSLPSAQPGGEFLACWYTELGALNQILVLRGYEDPAELLADRQAILMTPDPFGIGEVFVGMSMDSWVPFPFLPPIRPVEIGPVFEVRSYVLKPDGLAKTIELWRAALPARAQLSPVLTAMHSVSGTVTRFMHIWSYPSLDERARLRARAVGEGVWPPPGGPALLVSQQSDIYLPAPFSPIR
jgi:hypothetical protein